jgi:hypothetical protein
MSAIKSVLGFLVRSEIGSITPDRVRYYVKRCHNSSVGSASGLFGLTRGFRSFAAQLQIGEMRDSLAVVEQACRQTNKSLLSPGKVFLDDTRLLFSVWNLLMSKLPQNISESERYAYCVINHFDLNFVNRRSRPLNYVNDLMAFSLIKLFNQGKIPTDRILFQQYRYLGVKLIDRLVRKGVISKKEDLSYKRGIDYKLAFLLTPSLGEDYFAIIMQALN